MIKDVTAKKVLAAALSKGGEFADIFVEGRRASTLSFEDGRLDNILNGQDRGCGIRLIRNRHEVYAYTNDFSEKNLVEIASFVASQGTGGAGEKHTFNFKKQKPSFVNKVGRKPSTVALAKKLAIVAEGDRAARIAPAIRQVRVLLRDLTQEVTIINSLGEWSEDTRVHVLFSVQAVGEKGGVLQTAYEPVGGALGFELFDKNPPGQVAKIAAERVLRNLDAKPIRGGRMTVVMAAEAGGTMIHEAIGHGLEADLANEGLSVYAGKTGQKVTSDLITVVDDATIPGRRGSYSFDDEGTKSQKTVLVENGILKHYLSSRLTAMKGGGASTGNGRRQSYEHLPMVRMTNTYIAAGKDNPEDIIRSVDRGLLVTRMGGGQVNTVNGDFVFEVSEGFLIEGGRKGAPVRGATLSGNGPMILREIDRVGTDLGFGIGTCGKNGQGVPVSDAQPTMRIPEIIVGGTLT